MHICFIEMKKASDIFIISVKKFILEQLRKYVEHFISLQNVENIQYNIFKIQYNLSKIEHRKANFST